MRGDHIRVGELVKSCRLAAGLTQTELAERVGTRQSMIARYESGAVSPTIDSLDRLLHGCDRELQLTAPASDPQPLSGPIGRKVRAHSEQIKALASAIGASQVRVFGSVARGTESPDSDLDLLVDFPVDTAGILPLGGLARDIQDLLQVTVDITTDQLLSEPISATASADAIPV